MTEGLQKQLTLELAQKAVLEIAPQEKRAFSAVSEAYFKDPEGTLKGDGGGDELIGFGIGEVALLTPVILEVASAVVAFVTSISQKALEDALKESIKKESSGFFEKFVKFVRRILKYDQPQKTLSLPPLTSEQLIQVRQLAFEKAILLKLDDNQASLLADSLVGSLKLSS
jgi:hypothetical protein